MSDNMARKVKKDIDIKMIIIIAASVLVAVGILVGILACKPSSKNTVEKAVIADNVYVNSIQVGGLTVEEAKLKIEQTVNAEYFNKTVSINYLGESFGINLKEVVTVNVQETANAALAVKPGGGKTVVPFAVNVNNEAVKKTVLNHFLRAESKNNMFVFNKEYTVVDVDASKIQEVLDIDKTLNHIYENAKKDVYTEVNGYIIKNGEEGFADALYLRLTRSAENATVGLNEDQSTYIIPEFVGIIANKDEFMQLYSATGGKFQMNVQPVFPEIMTEDLDIEFYQDVLGTYTSKYDATLKNRTKNVTLAADFVNGTVIMPGQTFSYNNVVGKRSADRGFVKATVYTGEGTEEGLGGGICQVSSTIYCAQLRANLKTVSRTNHSYTVVYVPLGQDATVVYGVLDYVFENNTNYPIKIETVMGGGKLTVNILGTKVDKSLSYDVVSVTNSTTPKTEVRKETADLKQGETQVKQKGQNGAVVSTYKIYYKDGVEQSREYIGKSTYVPMNRIVLVGTAPVPETEVTPVPEDGENPDVTTPLENVTNTDVGTETDDEVTDVDTEIDADTEVDTDTSTDTETDEDINTSEPDIPEIGGDTEPEVIEPEITEPPVSDTGL